jgi:hypothetical protein
MGSITDLAVQCLGAVADDAAVQAFCQQSYGRGPGLIHGIDPENPPGQGTYPIVAVTEAVRSTSLARNAAEYTLGFLVAVNNETVTTAGGLTTYRGMVDAGDLSELVEAAVIAHLRRQFSRISLEAETGVESDYPLFAGLITITAAAAGSSRTPLYR